MADEFTNAGLVLPKLSDKLRKSRIELNASEAERIFKNPVDLNIIESPEIFIKTMKALDACPEADLLAIILRSYISSQTGKLAYDAAKELTVVGFAVFLSIQRAAVVLSKFVRYHERRRAACLSK